MTAAVKKSLAPKVKYTNADGTLAANLKTNSVFSKKRIEFTLANGTAWDVVQSGALSQVFSVLEKQVPIAKFDLTTLALKKKYPVDIAQSVDLPLVLGLGWAINFTYLRGVGAAGGVAAS